MEAGAELSPWPVALVALVATAEQAASLRVEALLQQEYSPQEVPAVLVVQILPLLVVTVPSLAAGEAAEVTPRSPAATAAMVQSPSLRTSKGAR